MLTLAEKIQRIPDPTIRATLLCESGGQQYWPNGKLVIGKAGEIGVGQFMRSTWDAWNKERDTDLDIANEDDQLEMIKYAFSKGYQHHWTCFNKQFPSKDG